MSEPIWSTGGAGGERAVTEDLEWAAGALGDAAARVASARVELARRWAALELGGLGPAWVSHDLRTVAVVIAPRLEADLDDTARRLAAVSAAYLDAERRARVAVGVVDVAKALVSDAWGGLAWIAQAAAAAGLVNQPLGVIRARGIAPDGPPPTTSHLTRDTVEIALRLTPHAALVAAIEAIMAVSPLHLRTRWEGELEPSPAPNRPAHSVEDIMRGLRDTEIAGGGAVRIERWTGQDGVTRRIVYIPGTQDWLNGSRNPSDVHADFALLVGKMPDAAAVVADALEADGARPGEPVMLAGHSLGGIVATALAAHPDVRKRLSIEAVVTAGSPTGTIALDPSVHALHLEGTRDIVPGLDARPNPDTPTRVTVHHDARDSEVPGLEGEGEDIASAHHLDTYAQTARLVDDGLSASTKDWLADQSGFFAAGKDVVVTEYRPG